MVVTPPGVPELQAAVYRFLVLSELIYGIAESWAFTGSHISQLSIVDWPHAHRPLHDGVAELDQPQPLAQLLCRV